MDEAKPATLGFCSPLRGAGTSYRGNTITNRNAETGHFLADFWTHQHEGAPANTGRAESPLPHHVDNKAVTALSSRLFLRGSH